MAYKLLIGHWPCSILPLALQRIKTVKSWEHQIMQNDDLLVIHIHKNVFLKGESYAWKGEGNAFSKDNYFLIDKIHCSALIFASCRRKRTACLSISCPLKRHQNSDLIVISCDINRSQLDQRNWGLHLRQLLSWKDW